MSLTKHKNIHKIIWIYKTTQDLESEGNVIKNKVLTKREREVFLLLTQNKTTREIADKLEISEKTVRNHISNVMQKLGVKGRAAAVVELLKLNEITL